jgi:hypothetical protein
VNRRARKRGPEPAPLSVEPLSAAVDLLMKRADPTLGFSIRRPRSHQAGLLLLLMSAIVSAALRARRCGRARRGGLPRLQCSKLNP